MQTQPTVTARDNIVHLPLTKFDTKVKGIAELKKDIVNALKEISSDPEMLAEFTKFMKNFRNYSLYNRLLIFCQYPEATQVAGFRTWKKLGRYVRKGEKGIKIFAPMIKVIEEQADDTEETIEKKTLKGYLVVNVFDYMQTESITGKDIDIPPFGKILVHDPEKVYNRIKSMAEASGLKVVESNMRFSMAGSTNGSIIWINKLTSLDSKCSTIIHEIAHVQLKHMTDRIEIPRNQKEVEAELTTFLAGLSIGLPRGNYQYIQNWLQGEEIKDEIIDISIKTADMITQKIDESE